MKLQKIRALAQEIIHKIDSSEGKPFENFRIDVTESQIICTWDALSAGEMDILFYAEGVHDVWQLSVRGFGYDLRIEDERFDITINRQSVWHVKAITDGHKEEDTGSNITESTIAQKVQSLRDVEVDGEDIVVGYKQKPNGSNRVVRQLPTGRKHRVLTLSYDIYFENGWSFSTKGDGNRHHKDTGYPYQTGKLHGIGSANPITGRSAPKEDQWSARVIWQRNTDTHKPHPDHPPIEKNQPFTYEDDVCLGVTYYDQTRTEQGQRGTFVASDFANFKNETWYTISLSVKLGEANQSNDKISLVVSDTDSADVLGGLNLINLNLRQSEGDIETALFNTFFGGNSEPFAPVNDFQQAIFRNIEVHETFKPYHKEELPEPSENWSKAKKIISDGEFGGNDYRIAGAFPEFKMFQSKHNLPNKALTASSVNISDNNPVLADAMSWQGKDNQGRAYRTGVATLIKTDKYIAYYRDRAGQYSGMRAMGVATSENGINWNQIDSPFMTVNDVERIIPQKYFEKSPVFTAGRVYIHHATIAGNYVYMLISTVTNGVNEGREYEDFIIRGTDPLDIDTFEFVETPWLSGTRKFEKFYKINVNWYRLGRESNRKNDGSLERFIVMDKNNISEPFSPEVKIDTGHEWGFRDYVMYFNEKWKIALGRGDIYEIENG